MSLTSDYGPFLRGDVDSDGTVNLSDPIQILALLFRGGPTPSCLAAADTNASGQVDISDPVNLLNYLFRGERPPSPPFPFCGFTSFESDLGLGCGFQWNC